LTMVNQEEEALRFTEPSDNINFATFRGNFIDGNTFEKNHNFDKNHSDLTLPHKMGTEYNKRHPSQALEDVQYFN